jgi:DNA-binding response OmpR family regulator
MKRTILYVEDNEDTAEAVQIILDNAGFSVEIAHTGNDGLDKIKKNKYDLLLLDVMLPDMSGWDIFEKVKGKINSKYAFLSAIPVSAERLAQLKKAGVSDYIMKPFEKQELIHSIQKILK